MNISANQFARIQDGASDLIGKCHVLYFAGAAIHPAALEGHVEDMDASFKKIASALGFRVEKIDPTASEPAAMMAAE